MKKQATNDYLAVRPDGELTRFSVPTFFSIFEVQQQLPGSILFIKLEDGRTLIDGNYHGVGECTIKGPTWVLLHNQDFFRVPKEPESERDAMYYWRQIRKCGAVI